VEEVFVADFLFRPVFEVEGEEHRAFDRRLVVGRRLGEAEFAIELDGHEQFAADQHAADFAGAGADLVELGVAPQAAGRVFVGVAVAAQRLDRLAGHPGRLLGGIEDGAGGVLAQVRLVAAVAGLAHGIDIGAAGLQVEYMSASLPCISWNSPIAWPNCLRSWT
jgi:hypothetical protein